MPQLMRTSNPALNDKVFRGGPFQYGSRIGYGNTMTLNGTVNKTGILLLIAMATAAWTWYLFTQSDDPSAVMGWMLLGLAGGFVCAMITIFKQSWGSGDRSGLCGARGPGAGRRLGHA
jgi:uncharacterized YccA/Bax inhibitor family protein